MVKGIEGLINQSIDKLVRSSIFTDWAEAAAVGEGDFVQVNNSFFRRQDLGLPTIKSTQYIVLSVSKDDDGYRKDTVSVVETDTNINVEFKKLSPGHDLLLKPLPDVIEQELASLGAIVTVLVGPIGYPPEPLQADMEHEKIKRLVLDARAADAVTVDGSEICLRELSNPERDWRHVEKALAAMGVSAEDVTALQEDFERAYAQLVAQDYRTLALPGGADYDVDADTILSTLVTSLTSEIAAYRIHVNEYIKTESDAAYHEVLRIAYNFSEMLVDVLRLFVGICDLKFIVFALTAGRQMALFNAFNNELPWLAIRKKPSINAYRNTVNGARNHCFHTLLSFDADLKVDLQQTNLNAHSLTLFPKHGTAASARSGLFDYEDRELISLLTSFTRTDEETVTVEWWERNVLVMEAALGLVGAMETALKALAGAAVDGGQSSVASVAM